MIYLSGFLMGFLKGFDERETLGVLGKIPHGAERKPGPTNSTNVRHHVRCLLLNQRCIGERKVVSPLREACKFPIRE